MKPNEPQTPSNDDALDSLKMLKSLQPSPDLQHRALQAMRNGNTNSARPPRRRSAWWRKSVTVPLPVAVLICSILGALAVYVVGSTGNNSPALQPVKQVENQPAQPTTTLPSPVSRRARTSQQVAFYLPSAGLISESQTHIIEREDQ